MAQSKAFEGSYESIVFERMSYLEQQHVANILDKIEELGGKPNKSGDVIAPIIELTDRTDSLEDILKADILVERKIMKDYTDLINLVGDDYGTEFKKYSNIIWGMRMFIRHGLPKDYPTMIV